MPTFEITAPDGRKFRVTGDNPEGAMQACPKILTSVLACLALPA